MPTAQTVVDIAEQMMWVTILLSMPVLLTSLVVGVLVSLVQTVTSVQEMTITFVPKLLAVLAISLLTLPWMIQIMAEYTEDLWSTMSALTGTGY